LLLGILRRSVLDTMTTDQSHLQLKGSLPLAISGEGQ
jgi:hypothetical protein